LKNKLTVAVIGAGRIAGGYDENKRSGEKGIYTHAGAYSASGKFILKTVFDIDRQRAGAFSAFWRVKRVADSMEDIYGDSHDVVSVCTPDETHFEIVKELVNHRCCKTIFIEKPLALRLAEIDELSTLAEANGIALVVNFQRRHDPVHHELRSTIEARRKDLLAANAYYMKGLNHICVTMIDTVTYLCGYPKSVLAYNRVYNQQFREFSYEFVLFYDGFNVSMKTTDSARFDYNYHLFELDLLFADGRITILDNSRQVRECKTTGYAYSGVKVLNDRAARYRKTQYPTSMVEAVGYLYQITRGKVPHVLNTPTASYNNRLIIEKVLQSYSENCATLSFKEEEWKR